MDKFRITIPLYYHTPGRKNIYEYNNLLGTLLLVFVDLATSFNLEDILSYSYNYFIFRILVLYCVFG